MGIEPTSKAWEVAVQILEDDMPVQGESLKPLLYKRFKDFSKIDAAERLVFGFYAPFFDVFTPIRCK